MSPQFYFLILCSILKATLVPGLEEPITSDVLNEGSVGGGSFTQRTTSNYRPTTSPSRRTTTTESENESDDEIFQGDQSGSRPSVTEPSRDNTNDICGTVIARPKPLITHGDVTYEGEFPWHAAIYDSKGANLVFICGASLINEDYLITTAYCITKRRPETPTKIENMVVYLGKHYLKEWSTKGIQDRRVAKLVVHPDFNASYYHNDIALLKLNEPVTVSIYVRPVCLWEDAVELRHIVDQPGTIISWGYDKDRVHKEMMPVVSTETCIWSDPNFYYKFTSNTSFCAGYRNGTPACNVRSGSGMVFHKTRPGSSTQVWQLRGLASARNKIRCSTVQYWVFSDVAKHLTWIKSIITSDVLNGGSVGGGNFAQRTTSIYRPTTRPSRRTTTKESENESDDEILQGDLSGSRPSLTVLSRDYINGICGTVITRPKPLITHGDVTHEGEFPWHAAIYRSKGTNSVYICGASLINEDYLITAAHCVTETRTETPSKIETLFVYLGKHYLKEWFTKGIQDRRVAKLVVHPDFDASYFKNDIALIKLNEPVTVSIYVRPVCLWEDAVELRHIVDQPGTITGWGYDEDGVNTDELHKAIMPVVSTETCIYSYPDFYARFTSKTSFCAGYTNGTSACNGDSGSGMVFQKTRPGSSTQVWQLRGIVSLSVPLKNEARCNTSHYVVFSDVAKHLTWIKSIIQNKNNGNNN